MNSHFSYHISWYAHVLCLMVLSPLVAEFLFGATLISRLDALIPATAAYGGGAVLVRELALQSIFNPDLYNAGFIGGRAFGVNWVWSLWTVGYHAVWSISIPILLAELLFPARRAEPWLSLLDLPHAIRSWSLVILPLAMLLERWL